MRLFNPHVDNRLSEYLDGRLSATEAARIEEHVAHCADCAADLDGIRKTIATLQTLPEVEAPRSFAINEAMVRPVNTYRPARWQAYAAPAAGMAVVFVLLLGGDLATSIDGNDDEDVAEEASQELIQMDELATEQGAAAEGATEPQEPAVGEDSAPDDEQDADRTFTEESEEEADQEEAAPLANEGADDSTTSEAEESAPAATPDPETIEQLGDVDDDDDTFRLFVRVIEALLAVGAFVLAALAVRRWLATR